MDIVKPDRAKAGSPDRPEYFSGTVRLHHLRRPDQPGAAELIGVFFDRGGRTIPHVHEADQVLYFVEGEGIVATERERRVLRAGDIAVIPGGTWHWHGATKTSAMCHVSIKAVGPTDWTVPRKNWEDY
jgi:quercetin dioxygenase-like cupin family protein